MTKTVEKSPDNEAPLMVVFGLDESQKPKAARFSSSQAELVNKAAQAMQLRVAVVAPQNRPATEIAKKLPVGRLYANVGKGFVPNIRRDLYTKLTGVLGVESGLPTAPGEPEVPLASGLPHNWDELAPGHLVIAKETRHEDGWWEAIVLERDGDMLTLRWRDYPTQPKVIRHRTAVALLNTAI
jgi:hypothetical protein